MRGGIAALVCLALCGSAAAQPVAGSAAAGLDAAEDALVRQQWSAGETLRANGQHIRLIRLDEQLLDRFGDRLPPRRRAEIQGRLARTLSLVGRDRDARAAFEAALTTAVALSASDRTALGPLLAEARFQVAEAERERAMRVQLQLLSPSPSLDKMNRWATSTFAPWLTRRLEATQRATRLYQRVSEPGRSAWEVAAAARIGELWLALLRSFRRVPIPAEIANDPALAAIYTQAVNDRAHALQEDARVAFEAGVAIAAELGIDDVWTRRCRDGLVQLTTP